MEDLALKSIEYALEKGVEYTDARLEKHYNEVITASNGKIERAVINRKQGIGIRVLVNGAWGFQSTTNLTMSGIKEAVNRAYRVAKASSKYIMQKVELAPVKTYVDSYKTQVKMNIEDISFEEKLSNIVKWEKEIHVNESIKHGLIDYTGIKIDKTFVNSEGTKIRFLNSITWITIKATSKEGEITQSYEEVIGHSGGYEIYQIQNIEEISRSIGEKACSLLKAEPVKTEKDAIVILDPNYLALLVHEIIGHPSEADRVLGREAAWAGTTWWTGKLGQQIGTEYLTVYDDPTIPGTLGYYLYDDEGVKARRKILIEKGILKEHMQSRETASIFNTEPNAGMRAITYEYIPLIRMSNTFWGEGDWTYEELIEDTKEGYLVIAMKEPSIDDKRYNWTISAQEGYKIQNGELTVHLRDIALSSTAPKFFKSVDAATKKAKILPIPGCGKGDPMQALYVGNGGPYIRGKATIVGVK